MYFLSPSTLLFQSTPSTRRETAQFRIIEGDHKISIHSLHTEGDTFQKLIRLDHHISIHSLHTEGDPSSLHSRSTLRAFQSTPSTRRETSILPGDSQAMNHFNPLPPHGGRLLMLAFSAAFAEFQSTPSTRRETRKTAGRSDVLRISIHSLHTEGDGRAGSKGHHCNISIHSLHTEGDSQRTSKRSRRFHFNPLPPHGGRHCSIQSVYFLITFQSTPSTRRETI